MNSKMNLKVMMIIAIKKNISCETDVDAIDKDLKVQTETVETIQDSCICNLEEHALEKEDVSCVTCNKK